MYKQLTTQNWWKYLGVALLVYTLIWGLLMPVPRLPILHETIRNLFFHVPMWFGMVLILLTSLAYSIVHLRRFDTISDVIAEQTATVGLLYGCLGLFTGMIWAKYTWGEAWSGDPQQNATAVGLLIYFAYFVLRGAIDDDAKRAKIAAVYNIFAFFMFIALIFMVPRLTDSLHPGKGGNPAFNKLDLDNALRGVFYPAVLGWTLLGMWIASLGIRYKLLWLKQWDNK